ncbi:MAG TPA: alpha/beta fold hydrolase [Verrucomicrobiae bacterium]|nr:alpha/beta fold hydrolase [Verrucomicrobiae bacterium]
MKPLLENTAQPIHRRLARLRSRALPSFAILAALVALFFPPAAFPFQLPSHEPVNPSASAPAPQAAASLDETAKQIVNEMVLGQFDRVEAQYDEKMAAALPPGKLATAWQSLVNEVGEFQSISATRTTGMGNQTVVIVVCKFERADLDARIAFDSDAKLAGLFFAPHQKEYAPWVAPSYANFDSFTESPLELVNGKYQLPGTLTMPKGDGPFPAVVLVQGSGPHDQDETIGPNKPFKDLAWGLASRGIAVYRYTKRTAKYGTEISNDPASLTVDDEVIRDAQAAVALLAKQPKIDASRVFLLGHSLGGYLAPRIASQDAQIHGLILLAAPTEPIEQLALKQIRYISTLAGIPSAQAQNEIKLAEDSVKQIESPDLKHGDTVSFLGTNSPASYWLDLRGYSPETIAATLSIPMLLIQGGRDYQVPPQDFDTWKKALAGKKNATLQFFPELNHMLFAGIGPATPQEYSKPGHVDAAVIAAIANWILPGSEKTTGAPQKPAN